MSKKHIRNNEVINRIGAGFRELRKAAGKGGGRRKAMSYILEKAVENVADQKEAMGIILHADAMDDAQKLRQMLVEKLPEMDIRIYPVGPVIGTHAGPGTIAFCFLGKKREI